jgi:hypothetical protein
VEQLKWYSTWLAIIRPLVQQTNKQTNKKKKKERKRKTPEILATQEAEIRKTAVQG